MQTIILKLQCHSLEIVVGIGQAGLMVKAFMPCLVYLKAKVHINVHVAVHTNVYMKVLINIHMNVHTNVHMNNHLDVHLNVFH